MLSTKKNGLSAIEHNKELSHLARKLVFSSGERKGKVSSELLW